MPDPLPARSARVRGRVVLPPDSPAGTATLHVLVEDVSRSDAAALVVGRIDMPGVALAAGASIDFTVSVPAFQPTGHYSVRAHVDRSGSGLIEPGDQVSTQSYPVLSHGHGAEVDVRVVSV